jgi:hypothetical protein
LEGFKEVREKFPSKFYRMQRVFVSDEIFNLKYCLGSVLDFRGAEKYFKSTRLFADPNNLFVLLKFTSVGITWKAFQYEHDRSMYSPMLQLKT